MQNAPSGSGAEANFWLSASNIGRGRAGGGGLGAVTQPIHCYHMTPRDTAHAVIAHHCPNQYLMLP